MVRAAAALCKLAAVSQIDQVQELQVGDETPAASRTVTGDRRAP